MLTRDLEYNLPPDLIATEAAEPRDSARLMVVRRDESRIEHRQVRDLADPAAHLLRPGDLLIFNQSRVLPAHFEATRASTGGRVTGLYLRSAPDDPRLWELMLESGGKLQPDERITFDPPSLPKPTHSRAWVGSDSHLELLTRAPGIWQARLHGPTDTLPLLNQIGAVPLPPYIVAQRRKLHQEGINAADLIRYNTIFAQTPGSVAAPTAGLHFTDELLIRLRTLGVATAFVTLHVGLGTFAPIRAERVEDHAMHHEWMSVPPQTLAAIAEARARNGRIIPVGTTSVRALESLPVAMGDAMRRDGYEAETNLLITPPEPSSAEAASRGWPFRFTDALMTNFHLPHSTLLALVAAIPHVGIEQLKAWYRDAIEQRYRFYSYGDAMLLL